jgi:hypothetical protein
MSVMTTYWFRPKRYGYGATPVTWQGWVVTFAAALIIAATFWIPFTVGGSPWVWSAVVIDVVVVVALVIVSRRKTEGGWRWRWGD